jgi:hypothetical protein
MNPTMKRATETCALLDEGDTTPGVGETARDGTEEMGTGELATGDVRLIGALAGGFMGGPTGGRLAGGP